MDLGISGKWALVCAASKGLGLGCAKALVKEGVNVVMNARTPSVLEASAADLRANHAAPGVQILTVACDITSVEGRAAVLAVRKDFDILVNNAGGPPPGDFREWNRDTWIKAVDGNMLTPIELIKALVDGMAGRGFGRIVNITSSAVKSPIDVLGLSNGARSGLTGFVAGLSRSSAVASKGVTINNLLPGVFDTDRIRTTFASNAQKRGVTIETLIDERRGTVPTKRLGHPDEFGAICAFLCSQHAGYINGQNILADGGAYPGTF